MDHDDDGIIDATETDCDGDGVREGCQAQISMARQKQAPSGPPK